MTNTYAAKEQKPTKTNEETKNKIPINNRWKGQMQCRHSHQWRVYITEVHLFWSGTSFFRVDLFRFVLLAPNAMFCSGFGAACSLFVHTHVSSNVVVVRRVYLDQGVNILQMFSSLLPLSWCVEVQNGKTHNFTSSLIIVVRLRKRCLVLLSNRWSRSFNCLS